MRLAFLFTVSLREDAYLEGIRSLQEVAMVERMARVAALVFLPESNI